MNPLEQHSDVAAAEQTLTNRRITVQIDDRAERVPGVSQRAAGRFCD